MGSTSHPIIDPIPYQWSTPRPTSVPHRCPVCEGRKTVDAGFYTSGVAADTSPVKCQSCSGNGIIWSF